MLQTKKIGNYKVAVAFDPAEILIRRSGKVYFGKEVPLARLRKNTLIVNKDAASEFGINVSFQSAEKTYPELEMYDAQRTATLIFPADGDAEPGCYDIIFEVDGSKYYCFVTAANLDEALGRFFKRHPHITYDMVVDHVEA